MKDRFFLTLCLTWIRSCAYFAELAGGRVFDEEADGAHPAPMTAAPSALSQEQKHAKSVKRCWARTNIPSETSCSGAFNGNQQRGSGRVLCKAFIEVDV